MNIKDKKRAANLCNNFAIRLAYEFDLSESLKNKINEFVSLGVQDILEEEVQETPKPKPGLPDFEIKPLPPVVNPDQELIDLRAELGPILNDHFPGRILTQTTKQKLKRMNFLEEAVSILSKVK